jgi:uncharacterized integral membrane protein (TIGR00697 family)
MIFWIYWAASLTIVTYAAVQILKRYPQHGFVALTGFYLVYLAVSQIFGARIISVDLGFYTFFLPASVFVYPFIAQVIDMINEVYGQKMAHVAIGIAFISQVIFVILILLVNSLPPSPTFPYETAWQDMFGMSIRITFASWISFLICSNLDAYVFARLKQRFLRKELDFKQNGMLNPYVWLRSSVSDSLSLTLDSIIFVTLAFIGVFPLLPLIIGEIIMKNIIGFIDNPWFVWYKYMLRDMNGNAPAAGGQANP